MVVRNLKFLINTLLLVLFLPVNLTYSMSNNSSKSIYQNEIKTLKAKDGSQQEIPTKLLLLFDFFKNRKKDLNTIIHEINEKNYFKNKTELKLFSIALNFIIERRRFYKDMNPDLSIEICDRLITENLHTIFVGASYQDLLDLWSISLFMDVKPLYAACIRSIVLNNEKMVTIVSEDGSLQDFYISNLLSFDFFKDATLGEENKEDGVKDIIKYINQNNFFKSRRQLVTFKQAIELIQVEETNKTPSRTIVEKVSKIFLEENFYDLITLWNISNFFNIKILCAAISHNIVLVYREKVEQFITKHTSCPDRCLQKVSSSQFTKWLIRSFPTVGNIIYKLNNYNDCFFCQNKQLAEQLLREYNYKNNVTYS